MGPWHSTPAKKTAPKRQAPSQQDRAILDLKNARDRLKRFQKGMESDSAKLLNQAQALHKAGKKVNEAPLTHSFIQ